jgi:hypothetical protein
MKLTTLVTIVLLLGAVAAVAQQSAPAAPPDWAQREFNAPADKVYAAALQSVKDQLHTIKKEDPAAHTVEFHIGVTAWSWGYNMVLTITPIDDNHVKVLTAIKRSGGEAMSWGSGKKEVKKIYEGMDALLAGKPNPHKKTS